MPKNIGENALTRIFELIEEKVNYLKGLIDGKAASKHSHSSGDISGLSTVATSGSYNDLSNKPTIPSAYSHPSTHPASMITGLATVATSGKYSDLSGKPTILSASNNGYSGAITAGGDGVAEMGKYIDFHATSNGTSDYSTRFVCTGDHSNTVNLPSATGTLIVGDRALKVVITSSAPTTNDTSVMTVVL